MGEFGFGQSLCKLPQKKGKVIFYETYIEVGNMTENHLFGLIIR